MSLGREHNLPKMEFRGQSIPLGAKINITCTNPLTDEIYKGQAVIWGIKPLEEEDKEIEIKFTDADDKPHYFNTSERNIEEITIL